jgi:N-methylhydantoinase A/oxoprolinase/acetone carboxylase beta subunit
MPAVVVPARAGVLSAVGMLAAPRQVDRVQSWKDPRDHEGAVAALAELAQEARRQLGAAPDGPASADAGARTGPGDGADRGPGAPAPGPGAPDPGGPGEVVVETLFDCRYAGQGHEISVPRIEGFHAEHERRNGFARPEAPVEVVALRASARLPSPIRVADLPDPGSRSGVVVGPAVIAEPDCTVWVAEGWTASVGGGGAWVLTR